MGTIRHQHQDSREVSAMATSLPAWLYQHIIAHTQDAIIFADGEGIIRLWNAGAETLFGYSAAEALGHSLDLIIPAPLRARHWEGYQRVMATGATPYARQLLAVPGLRKDGTRLSLEFTVVLIEEAPGKVAGIAAVLRDVTERWQRDKAIQARLATAERTDQETQLQTAEVVRQACIAAALRAYEDAGLSGLCHEGRWEYAVDAMRGLPLRSLVPTLRPAAEGEEGGRLPGGGTTQTSGRL
jgi:PAS domain S-box-containing protein